MSESDASHLSWAWQDVALFDRYLKPITIRFESSRSTAACSLCFQVCAFGGTSSWIVRNCESGPASRADTCSFWSFCGQVRKCYSRSCNGHLPTIHISFPDALMCLADLLTTSFRVFRYGVDAVSSTSSSSARMGGRRSTSALRDGRERAAERRFMIACIGK